jgi:hypothetical protein
VEVVKIHQRGHRLREEETHTPCNLCQRREFEGSDVFDRGMTTPAIARNRDDEKLNYERRETACWSG